MHILNIDAYREIVMYIYLYFTFIHTHTHIHVYMGYYILMCVLTLPDERA